MSEDRIVIKRSVSRSSIVFLAVVLLLTFGLYLYNTHLERQIVDVKGNIVKVESEISDLNKDSKIQIYTLLQLNKEVISTYEKNNKVVSFIEHLDNVKSKYSLGFEWFNLSKEELVTSIEVKSDKEKQAYLKTRDFIKNYRKDSSSLFDLDPISLVEWMNTMKYKVKFNIK